MLFDPIEKSGVLTKIGHRWPSRSMPEKLKSLINSGNIITLSPWVLKAFDSNVCSSGSKHAFGTKGLRENHAFDRLRWRNLIQNTTFVKRPRSITKTEMQKYAVVKLAQTYSVQGSITRLICLFVGSLARANLAKPRINRSPSLIGTGGLGKRAELLQTCKFVTFLWLRNTTARPSRLIDRLVHFIVHITKAFERPNVRGFELQFRIGYIAIVVLFILRFTAVQFHAFLWTSAVHTYNPRLGSSYNILRPIDRSAFRSTRNSVSGHLTSTHSSFFEHSNSIL